MRSAVVPIVIAIVNDYSVVVEGLAGMLQHDHRLVIVELDSNKDPGQDVDIVLFDAFAAGSSQVADVERLVANPRYRHVVVFTWQVDEEQRSTLVALGISGFVSKALTASELGDALVRVASGDAVIVDDAVPEDVAMAAWPGREQGLTPRESEIIALVTQGVTNAEIASTCYLSINSVKSYIRTAYRKMGVQRRTEAVLWGIAHGFQPQVGRRVTGP